MHKAWKNDAFTRDLNQNDKCEDKNEFSKPHFLASFKYYVFFNKKMQIHKNHLRVFVSEWGNDVHNYIFYEHAKSLNRNTLYFFLGKHFVF